MRILFLTHRLPYAPNRGDRIRAYYLLREMSRFADVSLFSLVHSEDEAAHAGRVPFAADVHVARVARARSFVRATRALATGRPVTHALLDAPEAVPTLSGLARTRPPDLVVAYCSGMARFALAPPLAALPCVIDLVDVDSAKWASLAASARGPASWVYRREAATLGAFEAQAVGRARATLVVNEKERALLLQIAPAARVTVVPNGIDLDTFAPRSAPATEPIVVFCGVMNYYPNVEGVLWFGREVWPLIRARRPDARFLIVGASPSAAIRRLGRDPSIEVAGAVEAVPPYLWRSAVAVAPLRLARGLQNKVLEAIAAGLPVAAVPAVLDGLPPLVRQACVSADGARAFAAAVVDLLAMSPTDRRDRAASGSIGQFEWSRQLSGLERLLRSAASPSSV